jgi:HEAT repeat protein
MTDEQRRRIVSRLNGRRQVAAFEAAKAAWDDAANAVSAGEAKDKQLERSLILTLTNGRRPFNRAAAAYAMQLLSSPRAMRALETVVKNKSEHPRVRGEAAEALAHRHRRKSHNVLLTALGDSSKEVRFWCAFALGEMAEKRAVAPLKSLAGTDNRVVRGWHSVAKEAADALKNIAAARKDWRRGRCVFCVRDESGLPRRPSLASLGKPLRGRSPRGQACGITSTSERRSARPVPL